MDDIECKNATETAFLQAGTPPHSKFKVPCSES